MNTQTGSKGETTMSDTKQLMAELVVLTILCVLLAGPIAWIVVAR